MITEEKLKEYEERATGVAACSCPDILALVTEVRRLREEREAGPRRHICTYCGHLEEADTHEERCRQMVEHMLVCASHPARVVALIAEECPAPDGSAPLTMHDLPAAVGRLRAERDEWHGACLQERDYSADLRSALEAAAKRFREYEALHRKRAGALYNFAEGERARAKADSNAAMAEMCEAALTQKEK